mgnify:CR=1 FL=1
MKEQTITKQAIVQSFKQLMKNKTFDKISISDITNACYLNRQTFYYHFQDKYELMNWIYYNEIFLPLVNELNKENYDDAFKGMFNTMYQEKYLYANALSMSSEYGFKEYLYKVLEELVKSMVENKKSQDIKFYTYGFVGTIIDWVQTGMKDSPDELASWMSDKFNKMS